jgi:uncharacterized protein
MNPVIFDTGPLVAWLCPRDQHHEWSQRAFRQIRGGGIICESVLTEVCHLAGKEGVPSAAIVEFVIEGGLRLVSLDQELPQLGALITRYADTPMDFADACITRLSELHEGSAVCTTDTDFLVYRKHRSQVIPLIAPFSK